MKTTKETADEILAKLLRVSIARTRPMMGEYLVYIDDKVAGSLNQGQLFIKTTAFGEQFAPELVTESPYDGAKPAFVVPHDKLDDVKWLQAFLSGTVATLPLPKK